MRNTLAVLAAAVVHFLFGAVWFTVLQKPWLASIGYTEAELMQRSHTAVAYGVAFVCNLVVGMALIWMMRRGVVTASNAWMQGLVAGFAIALPAIVTELMFETRSLTGIAITALYPAIGFALIGLVIGSIYREPMVV